MICIGLNQFSLSYSFWASRDTKFVFKIITLPHTNSMYTRAMTFSIVNLRNSFVELIYLKNSKSNKTIGYMDFIGSNMHLVFSQL